MWGIRQNEAQSYNLSFLVPNEMSKVTTITTGTNRHSYSSNIQTGKVFKYLTQTLKSEYLKINDININTDSLGIFNVDSHIVYQ